MEPNVMLRYVGPRAIVAYEWQRSERYLFKKGEAQLVSADFARAVIGNIPTDGRIWDGDVFEIVADADEEVTSHAGQ